MYNTIILKVGEAKLTKAEFDKFSEGDTIFGTDSNPTELQRWKIAEENEAKAQLAKEPDHMIIDDRFEKIIK